MASSRPADKSGEIQALVAGLQLSGLGRGSGSSEGQSHRAILATIPRNSAYSPFLQHSWWSAELSTTLNKALCAYTVWTTIDLSICNYKPRPIHVAHIPFIISHTSAGTERNEGYTEHSTVSQEFFVSSPGSNPQSTRPAFPSRYFLINFITSAMRGEENDFCLTNFLSIKSLMTVTWQAVWEQNTINITFLPVWVYGEYCSARCHRAFPNCRHGDLTLSLRAKTVALCAKAPLDSQSSSELFTSFLPPSGRHSQVKTRDTSGN